MAEHFQLVYIRAQRPGVSVGSSTLNSDSALDSSDSCAANKAPGPLIQRYTAHLCGGLL